MGFASGFRAGWDAVGEGLADREKRQLKEKLAQESARYGVTEGAYGQGLGENIQQVQGLQQQAIQRAQYYGASEDELAGIEQQYAPSIQELERRRGLTAPDYSVGSRAQNFGTRQEAQQAAAPMRTEGLANVYRQAGDVEKADELEARAFEQQRGLARAKREDELFPLQKQQLEGQIASQAQQQKLGELTLKDRERLALEQQNADAFQAFAAQNQNATVQELKDAAFKQFKFTPKQWQDTVNTRLGIEESEQKSFVLNIKNKLKGKTNLSQYAELYNTDPDFDDKTDLAIVPGKNGAVTLNFVDKATGRVTGSETFNSQAKAVEYLNKQATEPETIGTWMLNLRTKEAAIAASNRSNLRTPDINEYVDAQGNVRLIDVGRLPRDKDGQPVLPEGLRKSTTSAQKDLTPQQQRAFDTLKGTDAFKTAVERADEKKIRELLVSSGIPPEAYLGAQAAPPGGGTWAAPAPAATPAAAAATPAAAAATPRAAPTQGLTRGQVDQAVAQQQGSVQGETRVRRAAITAFEQDPRVRQAYDAVRQLRRDGQAARANNLESQINAQRQRFIDERVGGGR